jgi:uncharacterized protein
MDVGKSRPVALITGASGGIGAELARLIAGDGYDVVLVSRHKNKLEKIGNELAREFRVCWLAIAVDLSVPSQVGELIKEIQARSIDPELIVNNAGYGVADAAGSGDVVQQLGSINLNVSALSELTLKYLPDLISKNRGGIINVGSVAGFFPGPFFSVYYATKAYVQSFTAAIAHELKSSNVKICVICPGATLTGFQKRAGLDRSGVAKSGLTMTAEEVAKIGYAGYKNGRTVIVTGKMNRFLVLMSCLIPTSWLVCVVSKFNKT